MKYKDEELLETLEADEWDPKFTHMYTKIYNRKTMR